jgi:tRNA-dihydrouridine synthase
VSVSEKLRVMLEHTKLYTELLPMKNFNIMKKHYKAYVNGFDGAKELRTKLMECKTYEEIEVLTKDFINQLN